MISTNDVRPGMALDLGDGIFTIVKYEHIKPGKGKAFVRMKLKNVETGQVLDRTFRADEDVDRAVIDRREHQFLYRDDLGFHFMDLEEYTQFAISEADVGDAAGYLTDGMTVVLAMYEGNPIGVELPASVELQVTYAEPAVKGDTVSGATKLVTMETGLAVQVPLFIEQGERLKISTSDGSYQSRA
jgi:elongation factor P